MGASVLSHRSASHQSGSGTWKLEADFWVRWGVGDTENGGGCFIYGCFLVWPMELYRTTWYRTAWSQKEDWPSQTLEEGQGQTDRRRERKKRGWYARVLIGEGGRLRVYRGPKERTQENRSCSWNLKL